MKNKSINIINVKNVILSYSIANHKGVHEIKICALFGNLASVMDDIDLFIADRVFQ